MDLFLQPVMQLEKTAGSVDLPEDPNVWPKEILDELYKQVPYISDFFPHVNMSKVDAERAYGLGHVEVMNQQAQSTDPQTIPAGLRSIRIPVIVKDGKLCPFDIFINDAGKTLPLTESRLRQALFRPQIFDVASDVPGDQSTIGMLYPPYRQGYGYGSGVTQMAKMGSVFEEFLIEELEKLDAGHRRPKLASASCVPMRKTASLLHEISPTINAADQDAFCAKLEDPNVRLSFRKHAAATAGAVGAILNAEPVTAEKTASAIFSSIRPSVVQLTKLEDGYLVKKANHAFWSPQSNVVHRGELVRQFGEKVALAVDQAGSATLSAGAGVGEELEQKTVAPVTRPGTYKVFDVEGKELVGTVIPNLVDIDGEAVPLALFTNGSQATVQSEVFGTLASEEAALPEGPPQGTGTFFYKGPEGICALIPLTLHGSYAGEDGVGTMSGETYDGRPVEISIQANIQVPTASGEGRLIMPQSWKWMSMEGAAEVSLAGGPEVPAAADADKVAHVVEVRSSDPNSFTFTGRPVEKLGSKETQFVSLDQAMFLLAGLGVEQGFGVSKLAEASTGYHPVALLTSRDITPSRELGAWALGQVEKQASKSLKRDLVKEAALIPDPMAVDTVLSLGFINEENLMTFVSYLPTVDDAQMKMCELLLGARLGVSEIPEAALERAIRATEEVVEGLKVLAFQGR